MGAHTLGGCKPENSGYNGHWINSEEIYFNQKYYPYILGIEDNAPTQSYIIKEVPTILNSFYPLTINVVHKLV